MKTAEILNLMKSGEFDKNVVCDALIQDAETLIKARNCKLQEAVKSCYKEQLNKYDSAFKKFVDGGGKPNEDMNKLSMIQAFNKRLRGMFQDLVGQEAERLVNADISKLFEEACKQLTPLDYTTATKVTIAALMNLEFKHCLELIKHAKGSDALEVLTAFADIQCDYVCNFNCENWVKLERIEILRIIAEGSASLYAKHKEEAPSHV